MITREDFDAVRRDGWSASEQDHIDAYIDRWGIAYDSLPDLLADWASPDHVADWDTR